MDIIDIWTSYLIDKMDIIVIWTSYLIDKMDIIDIWSSYLIDKMDQKSLGFLTIITKHMNHNRLQ